MSRETDRPSGLQRQGFRDLATICYGQHVPSRALSKVLIAIPAISLIAAMVAAIVENWSEAAFALLYVHCIVGLIGALVLLGRLAVVVGAARQLRTPWRTIASWIAMTLLAWPIASAIWFFLLGVVLFRGVSTAEGGMQAAGVGGMVLMLAIVVGAWTSAATAVLWAHR
jgi:hypothetical protein